MFFLKKFVKNPAKIGGVTPSSRFLAKRMLKGIDWSGIKCVAELGAGTGVLTRQITKSAGKDCRLLVFEQDETMRKALKKSFPKAVFGEKAENLPALMRESGCDKADLIVSGLPFSVFDKKMRLKILCNVRDVLSEQGIFVAYQYSKWLDEEFRGVFSEVRTEFELLNLPPAFVYFCRGSGQGRF